MNTITQPVGAIGGITHVVGKAISIPTSAVGGTIAGIVDGISHAKAGTVIPVASSYTGSTVGQTILNFFSNIFGNFISEGMDQITKSGIGAKYSEALLNLGAKGGGESIGKLFSGLQGVGGKGLGLIGANFIGAGFGIVTGLSHAYASFGKFSDSCKGWSSEVVQSPLVHAMDACFGLATATAGAFMLFPGTIALGLPLMGVGVAGTLGMSLVKWAGWGNHWFNLPDTAPIGVSNLLQTFKNPKNGMPV